MLVSSCHVHVTHTHIVDKGGPEVSKIIFSTATSVGFPLEQDGKALWLTIPQGLAAGQENKLPGLEAPSMWG